MRKPRFTIITVCYNAEKCIVGTVQSVLQQTFCNFEYIIEDGVSKDSTLELATSLTQGNERVSIFSMPDQGIYDAMNKALDHATGEYIFFLNAGDRFCDDKVLERTSAFLDAHKADIAYGNIVQLDGEQKSVRNYGKLYRRKLFYLTGDCICHQAIFGRRELFLKRKFDTNYKICADRDWQLFWLGHKAKFFPMPFEVADVLIDGFSRAHIADYEKEVKACITYYFRRTVWIYSLILLLKKNEGILKALRKIECFLLKKE